MDDKARVVVTFPFMSLLAILFIGLKLTGYITWSWVWVLAPIWLPAAIVFFLAGLAVLFVYLNK